MIEQTTIAPESSPVAARDLRVDWIQYHVGKMRQVDCPLKHRFTPGLYTREIFMPAGTVVVSRVHKTEHPFVISMGRVQVWSAEHGTQELAAPYCGITRPGTRRVLVIYEDCIWTTFHPTRETDLDKLLGELTDTPDVSYIGEMPEDMQCLIRSGGFAGGRIPAGPEGGTP